MSTAITVIGTAILALLLAGYLAPKYLPPPKPKLVGIDLGTTYSCIGTYHPVSGHVQILKNDYGQKCIPSVVAFLSNNTILVGTDAVRQQEHNPNNTIYDAKRFIGKYFTPEEIKIESKRYPFEIKLGKDNMVKFVIKNGDNHTEISPEFIGSQIISTLRKSAEKQLDKVIKSGVISVPADFDDLQRNFTKKAAEFAGVDILRVISEPTAAALAYGLHEREKTNLIMVVDLGGGTLDVSLLMVQGGMFLTQGMSGNNHLGGQDFNLRIFQHIIKEIENKFQKKLTDSEDLQLLREKTESAKLNLSLFKSAKISLPLHSFDSKPVFNYEITKNEFENLNSDLFESVLEPIEAVLMATNLHPDDVDEVVLVGGSTRIPKIRDIIKNYFKKEPNVKVDPDIAVVSGVAAQAGILGGMWPLKVSAVERRTNIRKIHIRNKKVLNEFS